MLPWEAVKNYAVFPRDLLYQYRDLSLRARCFLRLRWYLTFFERIKKELPEKGTVLDIGCGYGLFSLFLAMTRNDEVFGFDPDQTRIADAKRLEAKFSNLYFTTDLENGALYRQNIITIIDVLYLLPDSEKRRMLKSAYVKLRPGGTLLLKINGKEPYWKYVIAYVEEWIMTRMGPTVNSGTLHFWDAKSYNELLEDIGFNMVSSEIIHSFLPQSHHLIVAKKPSTSHGEDL